ncbi:hypothetical protein L249_7467, partial [Ophiocordyceps polyrhachis-furcata BCC 54312]
RDIPYNDYAKAVTRIRHFLKSCNLYLARYLSTLRLMRYNVLVRASRRELIIYSADNLVVYSSAARQVSNPIVAIIGSTFASLVC